MPEKITPEKIQQFIDDGFIRIDNAFSEETAADARQILWKDLPVDPLTPHLWKEPVIRLGMYSQKPFVDSVNSPYLHDLFNQLVGPDKWLPCRSVGTFPVRFPTEKMPIDTGAHVDASFPGKDPANFFEWRVNIRSKGRALLMLVLYSDVTEQDAPTAIYPDSHRDIARILAGKGDEGLSFMELAAEINELPLRDAVLATGKAGTIYLCHPFLVHSARAHSGTTPKFMAQPPLQLRGDLNISDASQGFFPVEEAIVGALK